MVGQLVESNGDQFYLLRRNCTTLIVNAQWVTILTTIFFPEEQRIKPLHATAILTSRCV